MPEITCACVARDPFECVSRRYGTSELEEREAGTPCECACHDGDEDAFDIVTADDLLLHGGAGQ